MYFDCNALDRMDNNAPVEEESPSNPNEELKMDRDLGLFELIN